MGHSRSGVDRCTDTCLDRDMNTPRIANVTITPEADGGFLVRAEWTAPNLDRTGATGYLLSNKRVADRLATAIKAGAVFTDPEVKTDVNGKTYVAAGSRVRGRAASADLQKIGY